MLRGKVLWDTLPLKKYDLLLVPEVIEHVENCGEFLRSLEPLMHSGSELLVTAPNAFCASHMQRNREEAGNFIEIVHPDHNGWYSLYTLPNLIRKIYGEKMELVEVGLLEGDTMVFVRGRYA